MSDTTLSESARSVLARSLAVVESHKEPLVTAMQASLAAAEEPDEPFGQSDVTALLLVKMLLEQGRHLVETGRLGDLRSCLREQEEQDIDGRHYSRFGDALVPVMLEVLGPNLPHRVSTVWCDTFWIAVREMLREKASLPYAEAISRTNNPALIALRRSAKPVRAPEADRARAQAHRYRGRAG